MLDEVKLALRVSTEAFDDEIEALINAAYIDMGLAGVETIDEDDPIIVRAVTTYCKANFGDPENYERFKKSYDEQKAQLGMATGYTDYDEDEE